MELSIKNCESEDLNIKPFTIEDFRTITLLYEDSSDTKIYEYLTKDIKDYNCFDKLLSLLYIRKETINKTVTLNIDNNNITIYMNMWLDNLKKSYKPIKKVLEIDNIYITVDYPKNLYHEKIEDLILDSVYNIVYKGKELNLQELTSSEKSELFDKLSPKIIMKVYDYIKENLDYEIILMEKLRLTPEISINFTNNSAYELIKNLYNYYTYDDILEMLFLLSKKIPDLTYLSSRTPRDIEFFIKMYSEEIDKVETQVKL